MNAFNGVTFLRQAPWWQTYGGFSSALMAVMLFSLTTPMTQLALTVFPAELIALFRSIVAGACSLMLILCLGWRLPHKKELMGLVIGGAAVTLVFPYTLSLALGKWSASNMGVMLAGVPLITALAGSFFFKEKHSKMFWLSVIFGGMVLMLFAQGQSSGSFHYSVFIMLVAAGVGYVFGGHVAKTLGGWQTICWMCGLYLPVSAVGLSVFVAQDSFSFDFSWSIESVLAMLYLALISQWLGFHFWYGAMAKVGIGRAGQVQLLQPFFTLLFCAPLLGLALEASHFFYVGIISVTVVIALKAKPSAGA
jgi:drug/metabolite transporter (DMT)-like permease